VQLFTVFHVQINDQTFMKWR